MTPEEPISPKRRLLLEQLFDKSVETLLKKIEKGTATAAELAVAERYCYRNGISAVPTPHNALGRLKATLPPPGDEGIPPDD